MKHKMFEKHWLYTVCEVYRSAIKVLLILLHPLLHDIHKSKINISNKDLYSDMTMCYIRNNICILWTTRLCPMIAQINC